MILYSQSHDSTEFTLMLMVGMAEPMRYNGLHEDLLALITDAPQFKFSMPMKAAIVGQEICTVLAVATRRCTLPRNVTGVPSPESAASVSHRSQTTTLALALSSHSCGRFCARAIVGGGVGIHFRIDQRGRDAKKCLLPRSLSDPRVQRIV